MTSIILPTKNEEESIGWTIDIIRNICNYRIIVVDGHSIDKTVEIAKKKGVKVIYDNKKGKGDALITAFNYTNDAVIFVDCDKTYPLDKIPEFIDVLNDGFDVVIGERVKFNKNSLSKIYLIGDFLSRFLFKIVYRKSSDNLSGFRALSKQAIEKMNLTSNGFGIETEISAKAIALNMKIKKIPISYNPRAVTTKFNPFIDGFVVIKTIIVCRLKYL
ncbi:MAG: glycosyltransferase family 2 protein [Methanosarcinaceae archaeon]|jgi:dolichol-phosphate mannosyltransferase|nr:glycosyltransferase family 2 protein [Methanosarcinaceae archaeon]